MKKIKLVLISIITLTTFSCSKSSSDSVATADTPSMLYPSDYALKNTNGTYIYYVYFGLLNNPFSSGTVSSTFEQGSYVNKVIYSYNKPNGTILIGPSLAGNPTPSTTLVFKENITYPFTISGDKLTITANGVNYILTKEP